MRILNIVIAKIWGGGEQYVYDTSKALAKKGIKVYIAVDCGCQEMAERFEQVAEVIRVPLHELAGFKSFYVLSSFIKEQEIKFINCHSGHAMALCLALKMKTGVKLVCFKHNAIKAKQDFYHNWQRKHTDAFVCVSELVYDLQTSSLKAKEKEKFHLIYNGIDEDKYSVVERKNDATDVQFIGYAGRLARDKGLDVLLRAFKRIKVDNKKIKLLLAGSDEKGFMAKLKELVTNLDLEESVEFLGQVQDMPGFYAKLDVFVLPSIVREAFGLTICEAMYSGVPVITTDSGAQREIISTEIEGIIVPRGNVEALTEALKKLLENQKISKSISLAARIRVAENFTSSKCADRLQQLYCDME